MSHYFSLHVSTVKLAKFCSILLDILLSVKNDFSHSPMQPNNFIHRSEDGENQNPNLSTPVDHQVRSLKAAVKLSNQKKKPVDELSRANDAPRLKSTLSARNLFAGRTILNQITEFVGELKKLASRAKEREVNTEKLNFEKKKADVKEGSGELLEGMGGEAKERKPLLEVGKDRCDGSEMSVSKEKHKLNR